MRKLASVGPGGSRVIGPGRWAFTLIELPVVIAIIAILASLLLPALALFACAVQGRAQGHVLE